MNEKQFKQLLKMNLKESRSLIFENSDATNEENETLGEVLGSGNIFKKIGKFFQRDDYQELDAGPEEVAQYAGHVDKAYRDCYGKEMNFMVFGRLVNNFKKHRPELDIEGISKLLIQSFSKNCPEGGDTPDEDDPDDNKGGIPKETPLSIMKKQKDVKVGKGGEKEMPLVMHLQKLGISQKSAQQIAKSLGGYLKKRNIPIAEAISRGLLNRIVERVLAEDMDHLVVEDKDSTRLIKFLRGKMMGVLPSSKANAEKKAKSAEFVLAVHSVSNQPDTEKFKKFVKKRLAKAAKLGDGGWLANNPDDLKAVGDDEWKTVMKFVSNKGDGDFQKYHKYGKELRQAKADKKGKIRADIRDVGKEAGIIGKIISRFVSDNQKMIEDDPALAKVMAMAPESTKEDEVKFKKFVKQIRKMLHRQLLRRGWEKPEVEKMLENTLIKETIIRNLIKKPVFLHEMEIKNDSDMDISEIVEKLESFIPHAKKYMGYDDDPNLTFTSDSDNAKNILGKTAYYDPAAKEVTIYVDGRHPKDMMRSISHELVHHKQNCDGEFDRADLDVGEGYAQRDEHLKEMERQAYEHGNMCFREWEDNYKAENPMEVRNEQLYERLVQKLLK